MKKNKNKKNGFTLVELLGTIVVLSIVLGIVGLTITNTIKKAKAKSYQVTINEIESYANDYLIENSNRLFFLTKKIKNEETNEEYLIEYQCVTVRNLIDYGYLNNNIEESKIKINNEVRTVSKNDYIYIERDYKTKAVNEVTYNGGDVGVCERAVQAQGDIYIAVAPAGWNTYKNITINYRINNVNDVNTVGNYTYIYSYNKNHEDGPEPNSETTRTLKATENNGTIIAKIMNGDTEIASASELIDDIDLIGPVIKEGNYSGNKTVRGKLIYPLVVTDEGIGANYVSFTADDITVKIGGITIPQNGTTENYSL